MSQGYANNQGPAGTNGTNGATGSFDPYSMLMIAEIAQGNPNATPTLLGLAAGTVGQSGGAVQLENALGEWVTITSNTTAANIAGWQAYGGTRTGRSGPVFSAVMQTGVALTNSQFWIGLFSGNPTNSSDPAATNLAAFRYTNGVDTNWQAAVKDATTLNLTDTGVLVAVNSRYYFEVDATNPASIVFSVNKVIVATKTLNLPVTTTTLRMYCHNAVIANGTAVTINVRRMAMVEP